MAAEQDTHDAQQAGHEPAEGAHDAAEAHSPLEHIVQHPLVEREAHLGPLTPNGVVTVFSDQIAMLVLAGALLIAFVPMMVRRRRGSDQIGALVPAGPANVIEAVCQYLRKEVAERHPDLPVKLTRAFMEARDVAAQYMPADEITGYQNERDALGEDPYAYVMGTSEKRTLAAMNRYQIEQGLMKTMLPMDDLFIGHG